MNNLGLTQLSYTWEYTKHNKSETITQIYSNVMKKKKKKKKNIKNRYLSGLVTETGIYPNNFTNVSFFR